MLSISRKPLSITALRQMFILFLQISYKKSNFLLFGGCVITDFDSRMDLDNWAN